MWYVAYTNDLTELFCEISRVSSGFQVAWGVFELCVVLQVFLASRIDQWTRRVVTIVHAWFLQGLLLVLPDPNRLHHVLIRAVARGVAWISMTCELNVI